MVRGTAGDDRLFFSGLRLKARLKLQFQSGTPPFKKSGSDPVNVVQIVVDLSGLVAVTPGQDILCERLA